MALCGVYLALNPNADQPTLRFLPDLSAISTVAAEESLPRVQNQNIRWRHCIHYTSGFFSCRYYETESAGNAIDLQRSKDQCLLLLYIP